MPFNVFQSKGGGGTATVATHPFKVSIEVAKSGINAGSFNGKCPCDTGNAAYTSAYFFDHDGSYPKVIESGAMALKIYSGSMLYSTYSFNGAGHTGIKSFVGTSQADFNKVDCEAERKTGVMRVYGLNKPIFLKEFFPTGGTDTLKIWLTVCFPTGKPETSQGEFDAIDRAGVTCVDCAERANVPLTAFISCGIKAWPDMVVSALVDKGSPNKPRLEKRQVAANVPIAEIDASGNIVKQYLNSNLVLQDMCIQGIPCKFPIAAFSEFG